VEDKLVPLHKEVMKETLEMHGQGEGVIKGKTTNANLQTLLSKRALT